jgi:hypothetical protein
MTPSTRPSETSKYIAPSGVQAFASQPPDPH